MIMSDRSSVTYCRTSFYSAVAHSAPPDPLAGLQGWALGGRGPGKGREGREGEGGEGREKGGDGKGFASVEMISWIRPCFRENQFM